MMLTIEPLLGWTPAHMIARRMELRAKFWGPPPRLWPNKRIDGRQAPCAPTAQPPVPTINSRSAESEPALRFPPPIIPRITIQLIVSKVAAYYQIPVADLKSPKRTASVVRPRQIACYLARTLTLKSTTEIGRRLGRRDHTTVLHAIRKIAGLLQTDEALAEDLRALKATLAIAPRPSLQ